MTTLPFDLGPQARAGRECDCPPQVVKCCHFDGSVLALADSHALPETAQRAHWFTRFSVNTAALKSQPCPCGCGWYGWLLDDLHKLHYSGDSEADALAAFYRAEEELLRGDA